MLSSTNSAKDWSAVSLKSELGTGPIYRELAAQLENFQDELSTIAETGQPCAKHKGSIASMGNRNTTDLGSQGADHSSVRHHLAVSKTVSKVHWHPQRNSMTWFVLTLTRAACFNLRT